MIRRQARETAVQVLFQLDMTQEEADITPILEHWGAEFAVPEKGLIFAGELVRGTLAHLGEIDQMLAQITAGWHLARMANVDRNVLRLAAFEILFRPDIPEPVSLNEAIELAKLFGGEESAKFVNGILDKVVGGKIKTGLPENRQAEGSLPVEGSVGVETVQADAESSLLEAEAKGEKSSYSKADGEPENPAVSGIMKERLSSGKPGERTDLVKQRERANPARPTESPRGAGLRRAGQPGRTTVPGRAGHGEKARTADAQGGTPERRPSSAGTTGPRTRTNAAGTTGPERRPSSAGPSGPRTRANSAGTSGPRPWAGSAGTTGPERRTSSAGTTGPRSRPSSAGTTGPERRTSSAGTTGPRSRTGSAGTPGPRPRTSSAGTSGPRPRTGSAGTTGPEQRTSSAGTPGPRSRTNAAGTSGPERRTSSAGTSGQRPRTGSAGSSGPRARTNSTGSAAIKGRTHTEGSSGPKRPGGPKRSGGSKGTAARGKSGPSPKH